LLLLEEAAGGRVVEGALPGASPSTFSAKREAVAVLKTWHLTPASLVAACHLHYSQQAPETGADVALASDCCCIKRLCPGIQVSGLTATAG
jgi:hypothetical protein